MGGTPFEMGFRMPAEWERHESTWLSWPKDPLTFPPGVIDKVEAVYVDMVRLLARGERVDLLVDDDAMKTRVSAMIGDLTNVRFHKIRTADVWTRDYCPTFVKARDVAAVKWRFNAWGEKYDELKPDDEAGMGVARESGLTVFQPGIVLEGGSIDVNGLGTCLTTEQCLLNQNRNPGMSREQISRRLKDFLGTTKVVWLRRGIEGDDTDGHVDDIARFVGGDTVLCMVEEDKGDPNFPPLNENLAILEGAHDQDGKPLRVVPVAMPRKKVGGHERLPASYANFYVANAGVLVPIFNDANDDQALSALRRLFPTRSVVGLNSEALVSGFGGLHCVTQQQPA